MNSRVVNRLYFYTTGIVITPRPGITAMIEAIDGLVR